MFSNSQTGGAYMISPNDLVDALEGKFPKRDHALTYEELGKALAPHRKGRYPGTPFGRSYISNLIAGRQPITKDFQDAFLSWRRAEIERLDGFRSYNVDGLGIDELLQEVGQIQEIGEGPIKGLFIYRSIHPELIRLNGLGHPIQYNGEYRRCAWNNCNIEFIPRSWNHIVCNRTWHEKQERDRKRE